VTAGAAPGSRPLQVDATPPSLVAFATEIERFDRGLRAIDDEALDLFWAWEAYDEEGVRFGILRTTEEVGDAAVEIAAQRAGGGDEPTVAQRILGRYLVAWRELWSVADRADAALDLAPEDGEWSLRQVLDHVVEGEMGFLATIRNGLDQRRDGIVEPRRIRDDEAWFALTGVDEDSWRAAFRDGIDEVRAFHRGVRDRALRHLAPLTDEELAWTSPFWDGSRSNRFRLGRFESHLRQHTIQTEKTVQAINGAQREVERLLRLLARALGDAEAAALGADPGIVEPVLGPLTETIRARADELIATVDPAADGDRTLSLNETQPLRPSEMPEGELA